MKGKLWIILFFVLLLANLVGVYLGNDTIWFITKPLLLIVLSGYFLSQTQIWNDDLKRWIFAALLFSWIGDVLLLFEMNNSIFFLLGLLAFLLAHIFYIGFFHIVRLRENVKSSWLLLVIIVIYYTILMVLLSPHLGKMKLPVRIYGIVICFMFMLAMHMLFIRNKIAGRFMMLGAFLFVISDSALAINKFYSSFELAGVIIMLTYGVAQFLIVEGATRYIRSVK